MPGSFAVRSIDVTFRLGQGSFGNSGFDTVKLSNLRVSTMILKAGGASLGQAHIRIWGMTLELMNRLSTLGMIATALRNNQVQIEAGDSDRGMSVVFDGNIVEGWADFQGMPDVAFQVTAAAGMIAAMKPIPPSSYRGGTDVAVIMQGLATQMSLPFENNGVEGIYLNDPYLPGTAREQARKVANAAGINWLIDNGKLSIWPRGRSRGDQITLISPTSGLIGYPSFTSNGISFVALYNPNIGFGSRVRVESSLTPASGEWIVSTLVYNLEAQLPNGNWFMRVEANPPGFAPVVF